MSQLYEFIKAIPQNKYIVYDATNYITVYIIYYIMH